MWLVTRMFMADQSLEMEETVAAVEPISLELFSGEGGEEQVNGRNDRTQEGRRKRHLTALFAHEQTPNEAEV